MWLKLTASSLGLPHCHSHCSLLLGTPKPLRSWVRGAWGVHQDPAGLPVEGAYPMFGVP